MTTLFRLAPVSVALRRMTRTTSGGTPRSVMAFMLSSALRSASYHDIRCIVFRCTMDERHQALSSNQDRPRRLARFWYAGGRRAERTQAVNVNEAPGTSV